MERVDELSLSAQQARVFVQQGIEPQLAGLRRFDNRKRLLELAFVPTLWLTAAALTLLGRSELPPGWARSTVSVAGMLISGVAINALVLLLHEGMHHTLFASPLWNRWVSFLCGVPVLMSFSAYQVMHLRHHTYLGDPRDPDDYANYTTRPRLLWLMHFLRLASGAFLYLLLIPWLALKYGRREQRVRVLQEYALLILLLVLAVSFVPGEILLWGWLLP